MANFGYKRDRYSNSYSLLLKSIRTKKRFPGEEYKLRRRPKLLLEYIKTTQMQPEDLTESMLQTLSATSYLSYSLTEFIGPVTSDIVLKSLARSVEYSYSYACNVIKGRFLEGEDTIATDPCRSFDYFCKFFEGKGERFLKGEPSILKNKEVRKKYMKIISTFNTVEHETS
jgi:hypothetical protein